jgi:hypothetical protein
MADEKKPVEDKKEAAPAEKTLDAKKPETLPASPE